MADKFPSTLLVSLADKLAKLGEEPSRRDVETEIRKADLDLLDKLNQLSKQISTLPTTASIPTVTKEVAYTPTFTGFGTVSAVNFTWTRVGNRLKVMGKFVTGTSTGVEARISLPNSLVSDSGLVTTITAVGFFVRGNAIEAVNKVVLIESGAGYITVSSNSAGAFTKQNGTVFGNNEILGIIFELPVSGWNS